MYHLNVNEPSQSDILHDINNNNYNHGHKHWLRICTLFYLSVSYTNLGVGVDFIHQK